MKRFLLSLIIFSFCIGQPLAQTDSTFYSNATQDSIIQYLSPLEYAFMMHEETKFMLRLPILGVGAEMEISPYFTMMTQIYFPMIEITSDKFLPALFTEFRWYYGSRRLGVRNMSGNYISVGAKFNEKVDRGYIFDGSALGVYGKWGIQRRILGNGLADIGVLAGISPNSINGRERLGLFVQSSAAIGMGFVFGKRASLDRERLCPVIKCHEVERFLLKFNFADLVRFYTPSISNRSDRYLSFNPNISSELKIFDLPISINAELKWNIYEGPNLYNENSSWKSSVFEWTTSGRWYYNMGRRMRLGKSGNGLSANYIAAGVGGFHFESNFAPTWKNENPLAFLSTGMQRTLSKHLYYDLNIGIRQSGYVHRITNWEVNNSGFEIFGNAHMGIKF